MLHTKTSRSPLLMFRYFNLYVTICSRIIRIQWFMGLERSIGVAYARLIRLKPTYIFKSYSSLGLSLPIFFKSYSSLGLTLKPTFNHCFDLLDNGLSLIIQWFTFTQGKVQWSVISDHTRESVVRCIKQIR